MNFEKNEIDVDIGEKRASKRPLDDLPVGLDRKDRKILAVFHRKGPRGFTRKNPQSGSVSERRFIGMIHRMQTESCHAGRPQLTETVTQGLKSL